MPPESVRKKFEDFSDTVQGEEYEIRKSVESNFPIKHRIAVLGEYSPPQIVHRLTPNQLVMIAGAALGFLAGVVVCPLDVVKTRAQAQGALGGKSMRGYVQVFKDIVRNEGVTGLYRGVVPITIGYLPTWMIYFTVYERAKLFYPDFLQRRLGININTVNHFFSAITAGMASSIAVNPIWVVKTRMMVQTGRKTDTHYSGTFDAFRKMYREEGIRVFYSGLVPSLFGLLHVGIHFPVYEFLKDILHCNNDSGTRQNGALPRLIIASTFSKMTASTLTYPHEILRTRLQIKQADKSAKEPQTLKAMITSIYRKEGLRGFYAGYGINLLRTLPASAVTLVSFEYFKTYFLEINGHTTDTVH